MSITFPFSLTGVNGLNSLLRIASATLTLPDINQEFSGLGNGQTRAKDLSPRLWRATITTVPYNIDDAEDLAGLLDALDGSVGSFYITNPRRYYPKGGFFSETNLKINSVAANYTALSLKGLPAGYTIYRGDTLSWSYGTPSRRAYHRVLETVVANGSGVTAEFAVAPLIQEGAVANIQVNMNPAYVEMMMMPGTLTRNVVDALHDSYTFTALQVNP